MAYKVIASKEVEEAIDNIHDYIATVLLFPQSAKNTVAKILDSLKSLEIFSEAWFDADEKIGVKINSKYPSRGKIIDQYVLLLTGALKMSQQLTKNPQYNDLTVRYYLGMTFPKYNHPAKLYDEINLDKVDNIRKSKETISYYIGFYKDGKLIKFEKYINANKVMDFAYEYDEMGNLIKIYKNNIEVGKPIQKRM